MTKSPNNPKTPSSDSKTPAAGSKTPAAGSKTMSFIKKGIKNVHSFGKSVKKVAKTTGKVVKFATLPARRPLHTALIVFVAWWGIGKIGTEYHIPTTYDYDSAAWVKTTDEAIKKVDGMTHADFQKMDHAELYGLIRMIHGSERTDEMRIKMLTEMPLDPDYVKYKSKNQKKLHDWLANSPTIHEAAEGWENYNNEERLATLRLIAAKHSAIYGYSTPFIFNVSIPEIDIDTNILGKEIKFKGILGGAYNPAFRYIMLNSNKKTGWNSFAAMVNTIIHENTHSMQAQLGHRLLLGEIDKTDPRFDQARLFRYNTRNYANTEGYNTYKSQPMERESFIVGKAAERIIILNYGKSKGDIEWENYLNGFRKAKLEAKQKANSLKAKPPTTHPRP